MIAGSVDTNVLVHLIAQDDPLQAQAVDRLFARHAKKSERLMVPVTVVWELEWVLRSRLSQTKAQVIETVDALLTVVELSFESEDAVEQALADYQEGNADFGECLHLALARKGRALPFYTFDKRPRKPSGRRHCDGGREEGFSQCHPEAGGHRPPVLIATPLLAPSPATKAPWS